MALTRRLFLKQSILASGSLLLPARLQASRQKSMQPAYLQLMERGELAGRIEAALAILDSCRLCPRQCGVNRSLGERGFCQAPRQAVVYSAHPHMGEERALVGRNGSGTIFFSHCNLRCVFCQNWPISHEGRGTEISDERLADMMLELQRIDCHNINLVTPTHVMPNILRAAGLAASRGLRLPLVYNTSGYERVEILKMLDGIVDIYLPDMKFMHATQAGTYLAGAEDYPETARKAILEMQRQVGRHRTDEDGIARRGLMIRHLVMPNRVAGTREFVSWVADRLPRDTYVNIMHQYHVDYKAYDYPQIRRGLRASEFLEAVTWARQAGLTNLDPDTLRAARFFEGHRPRRLLQRLPIDG
jgi:putative pyruvate formate lyase activating enzyme